MHNLKENSDSVKSISLGPTQRPCWGEKTKTGHGYFLNTFMEKWLWLEGNSHSPLQSLGMHTLGNILPTVINFIHYLEWFSSPLRRGMRAKRLENLSHCFSLQILGKELHWQNYQDLRGSVTQSPITQWLGAPRACTVISRKP